MSKAKLPGVVHPNPEELPDDRFCSAYNCPVCRQIEYTLNKLDEPGFLSPVTVKVWLGESIHTQRHKEQDELTYIENTLEMTGMLLQTAALMADAMIIEKADIKTLKKMKEDYKKLLELL